MKNDLNDIQELADLENQQEEITRRRKVILKRMAQRERHSSKTGQKFTSKMAAMEYILRKKGSPQHVQDIAAELIQIGFITDGRKISGMLRNYSMKKKTFTAEGKNTFGLIDWSKKSG